MILPDANLLLYAVNTDSNDHAKAIKWWRDLLESGAAVGLYTSVVFAFVRLSTNRRVFPQPLSTQEAFAYLHNWLDFPSVSLIDAELEDINATEALLTAAGTAANLVSDAQIAAAALRLNGTVHSADTDFGRFTKLEWVNPLDS
ncbi:MAG: TA system VapC family ribonuclease toxin [Lentimonas sp.]